jgi:hypothetical protein
MLRNVLAVCIAVALLATHPLPAAACSVGPDFDPRDSTQLLVLGRARSIELGPVLGPPADVSYLDATVTVDVIHVLSRRHGVAAALRRQQERCCRARSAHRAIYTAQPEYAMYRWLIERHGVTVPFLVTGPVPDVGVFGPALAPRSGAATASYPAEKLGQRDVEPTREVRERGERRRHPAGLHLPHVLALEVDAAALVGAELRHREPALPPHRTKALAGPLQQERLAGDVGIDAGRHQSPRTTKSTIASIASAP